MRKLITSCLPAGCHFLKLNFLAISVLLAACADKGDEEIMKSTHTVLLAGHPVTLRCTVEYPQNYTAWAVQLDLPENLTPSEISDNGIWNSTNRTLKWGPWFDNTKRELVLKVEGPIATYEIQAVASFDGREVPVSFKAE